MGEVIELAKHRPHLEGTARCLHCGHQWEAVCPTGCIPSLECSECTLYQGTLMGFAIPAYRWKGDCGRDVFFVTPEDVIGSLCGTRPVI